MIDRAGARTGKVLESRAGRRLLVQLERGANVVDEIAAVCRQHQLRAGELRATGTLEQLQVSLPEGPLQEHKGALDIVSFVGHLAERDGKIELVAQVFVAARGVRGIEVVGGRLIRARGAAELVIETLDDVRPTRTSSSLAGLEMWRIATAGAAPAPAAIRTEPPAPSGPDPQAAFERRRPLVTGGSTTSNEPAPTPEPATEPTSDWSAVMAASASERTVPPAAEGHSPTGDDDDQVRPGDLVDHPKFGRCQVERIEGDHEFISVRLRNQRLIRLSLDVLNVVAAGTADGQRLFRLVPAAG
jgi:predicted DNA-binding protein with PD1-like motif